MNDIENDTLAAALERHGIQLEAQQIQQLDAYCRLLWDWNAKLNLTRHTDYERFVSRDVVDSQALAQFLEPGERILDVGTGGGVPGIVLAIVRPDLKVELSESVAKKARATAAIVTELKLPVTVHHARAEQVLEQKSFGTLVVRAVAPLAKLIGWFNPYWESFNRLLVIKGPAWVEERKDARERGLMRNLALRKLAAYPLPGTDSESVVLSITPKEQA